MSVQILLYKNLNLDKIKFAKTVYKNNDRHYIDIFYEGNTLFLQTPTGVVENVGEDFLEVSFDDVFVNYISSLEKLFKEKIYKHSVGWFNGRQFSKDKIEKSLVSIRDGNVVSLKMKDNVSVFNQNKDKLEKSDLKKGQNVVLLVKIKALEFVGNKFTYTSSIEQIKSYTSEELNTYSILDEQTVVESVSSEDELENVDYESNEDFF